MWALPLWEQSSGGKVRTQIGQAGNQSNSQQQNTVGARERSHWKSFLLEMSSELGLERWDDWTSWF